MNGTISLRALAPLAVADVTRICLAPATVEAAANGVDPMTAVRETFTSFLTVPSLAATPLEPAQFRFAVPAS